MAKIGDVFKKLNYDLGVLTDVDTQLTKLTAERDAKIKEVSDQLAPGIDHLTRQRKRIVDQISESFQAHRRELLADNSKTLAMRNGNLSARFAAKKVVIDNENQAMAYARAHGMLRKLTKVGKRSFVKATLKDTPDFVNKAPGMHFEHPESLIITLTRTKSEIVQELTPLRRRIS